MKWKWHMVQVKGLSVVGLAAIAAILTIGMEGQPCDPATPIQEALVSQIKLTNVTADHSDIVSAGDVLALRKDGLMMRRSRSSFRLSNTYSDRVLASSYNNRAKDAAKSFFKDMKVTFINGKVSNVE